MAQTRSSPQAPDPAAAARRLLYGVVGHVDHGKTALVRALTGMETDRLEEERRRGISIALGFAHRRVGDVEIDLVDMPGHERFVRTMVSGATGIDAVLLVVSASEGVKPQTIEHLDIAALLGIRHAVIAVTKADLVDADALRARTAEAARLVADAGLAAAPPIATSALTNVGLDALGAALADLDPGEPRDDGFPYLPVDRAFSIAGHGTVATGTLRRGALLPTTPLAALPGGREVRVRGLQVHGGVAASARPGQRVAVNLRGIDPGEVPRGTVLTRPGLLAPSEWLTVEITTVKGAPQLPTGARLRLLHGTAETGVRLRLLDRDALEPGDRALAQLRCETPVAVPARERFVLRTASPATTLAGGIVLDPAARRERRRAPAILARLAALATGEGAALVAGEIARCGGRGIAVERLAALAGTVPERARAWIEALPVVVARGGRAVDQAAFDRLSAALPAIMAKEAEGLSAEQIAGRLKTAHPDVVAEVTARLVAAGVLRREGGLVRAARPAQDRAVARRTEALAARIEAAFRAAGLAPPDLAAVSADPAAKRVANGLVRDGILVRAPDRAQKREILFHRDAILDARRRLVPALEAEPGLLVREAGALLGISRKYSVPLLEHLDAIRVTRRRGDYRVLAAAPPAG